jgi:adenylosuccinate lyase
VLLALTQAGLSREEAYQLVQQHAMQAWKGEQSFQDLLKADPKIAKALPAAELDELFDLQRHTAHVDEIFERVFGKT